MSELWRRVFDCSRCGGVTDRPYCECHYGSYYGPRQQIGGFQILSPQEVRSESWWKIEDLEWHAYRGEERMPNLTDWLRSYSGRNRQTAVKIAKKLCEIRAEELAWRNQAEENAKKRLLSRKKRTDVVPVGQRRFETFRRDGFKCVYCGNGPEDGAKLQIDHVMPTSRGGKDDARNRVTACKACNTSKGATVAPDVVARFAMEEHAS